MEETKEHKTRQGSGYLKQLYSTARTSAGATHTHLRNLTTFLVNFIPVDKVDASELQVRTHFDAAEIDALAHSIKEHGVLQPILVVQDGERYKVIAGERRLRASRQAGLDRIPARVLTSNDKATHEIALRENLDRVDLHPLEEGEGYVSLLNAKAYNSHDEIAKAFGKPKSRITECIGFTKLPLETKKALLGQGVRNRSLLRNLLATPPEQHIAIIAEAAQVEEVILTNPATAPSTASKPAAKALEPKAYEFKFSCTSKGIKVPGFNWKAGEGKDKLNIYVNSLKALVAQLEKSLGE